MFSSEVTVIERARRVSGHMPEARSRYGAGSMPDRALVRVLEVSKYGARLEIYCDLPQSTTITLKLPVSGTVRARIVWSKEFEAGCRFLEPILDEDVTKNSIFKKGHA